MATIQYRKSNSTLGSIESDNCSIRIENNSFTIIRRTYGYDEYDFYDDEIKDIIELRI